MGVLNYSNGDSYEGEFKNGKKHGNGTMNWDNGKYKGQWKENLPDGEGIYTSVDGSAYEGSWKNGKQHGKGMFFFYNGDFLQGDFLQGDWKNGMKDGQGQGTYSSASTECMLVVEEWQQTRQGQLHHVW